MSGRRGYLWAVLVWVLIPFTMAAGLPRMRCRCAAAKGLMFCECCFRKSNSEHPLRDCCHQEHTADESSSTNGAAKPVATQSSSDCPICPQMIDRHPGSCCNWTSAVLTTPTDGVKPPVPTDVVHWDILPCDDTSSSLASFTQRETASTFLPQLDRLSVSQHLVI